MGSAKLKLLVAAGMSLAVFGTASVGLYHADGQEKAKASTDAKRPAETKPVQPKVPPAVKPPGTAADYVVPQPKTSADVRAILSQPCTIRSFSALTLDALLQQLSTITGIPFSIDYAAFTRSLASDYRPGEMKINLPVSTDTTGMSLGEALTQVVGTMQMGFQIRGNRVVIVPVYHPPSNEGILSTIKIEQYYGPPVWVNVDNQPLPKVLQDLRKQTGANIVLDARSQDLAAKQSVILSLNDVRLRTALTVLADMSELRLVQLNNVYYLTTPQNADRLEKEIKNGLLGGPQHIIPPE